MISFIGNDQLFTEFVDLAIKCCDDLTNISMYDISCLPTVKCTMTPVKIRVKKNKFFLYIFQTIRFEYNLQIT